MTTEPRYKSMYEQFVYAEESLSRTTFIGHNCAPLPGSAGCVYEVARSGVLATVAASHCHNTRQGNYNYNHSPPLHCPPPHQTCGRCAMRVTMENKHLIM